MNFNTFENSNQQVSLAHEEEVRGVEARHQQALDLKVGNEIDIDRDIDIGLDTER